MTKKRKKNSILLRLRNYFFTGVVVLIPIGFTLYLTVFLIKITSSLVPKQINPNSYLPFSILGLEIIISVIIILTTTGIKTNKFNKLISSKVSQSKNINIQLDSVKFKKSQTCVLIGPEGDFTENERIKIKNFENIYSLKINNNILRTETATISALSIINYILKL